MPPGVFPGLPEDLAMYVALSPYPRVEDSEKGKGGISAALIAGVAVAATILLVVVAVAALLVMRRKRRRRAAGKKTPLVHPPQALLPCWNVDILDW